MNNRETRSVTLTSLQWTILEMIAKELGSADVDGFLAQIGEGKWSFKKEDPDVNDRWWFEPGGPWPDLPPADLGDQN